MQENINGVSIHNISFILFFLTDASTEHKLNGDVGHTQILHIRVAIAHHDTFKSKCYIEKVR